MRTFFPTHVSSPYRSHSAHKRYWQGVAVLPHNMARATTTGCNRRGRMNRRFQSAECPPPLLTVSAHTAVAVASCHHQWRPEVGSLKSCHSDGESGVGCSSLAASRSCSCGEEIVSVAGVTARRASPLLALVATRSCSCSEDILPVAGVTAGCASPLLLRSTVSSNQCNGGGGSCCAGGGGGSGTSTVASIQPVFLEFPARHPHLK